MKRRKRKDQRVYTGDRTKKKRREKCRSEGVLDKNENTGKRKERSECVNWGQDKNEKKRKVQIRGCNGIEMDRFSCVVRFSSEWVQI